MVWRGNGGKARSKVVTKLGTFRSKLEVSIANTLKRLRTKIQYETLKIPYKVPASDHTYLTDFFLPNGIIIEGKGIFDSEDRTKHLLLREQHPDLDIRFVFSNANAKLYKGSRSTYASWCDKNGFLYAHRELPTDWVREPTDTGRLRAALSYLK